MSKLARVIGWYALFACSARAAPTPDIPTVGNNGCRKTQVAVLGAGVAGITAAQVLSNASITDFVIVEFNDQIGGRVRNHPFGKTPSGNGTYFVELGANWVQGTNSSTEENPIWTLAKKNQLINTYSDFSSRKVYNETGEVNIGDLEKEFYHAFESYEEDGRYGLLQNLQDRSARTGFSIAKWKPGKDPLAQVIEWAAMDFEYANPPEKTSHRYSVVSYDSTFHRWADENNFVHDPRGFSTFVKNEAATYLKENDPRLLLNTVVENITYSSEGVEIHNNDGSCISAEYAVCTFSLGVLQQEVVKFSPELPEWKRTAIHSMTMGTYTKIFLQFRPEDVFWDKNTQFFLYADPIQRGYFPLFQSLDHPDFEPGSGILFVTVVDQLSFAVEAQDFDTTKKQVMAVLRRMFGNGIADPIDFYYPQWSLKPWAFGSFSNWPPSLSLETHQNLRANLGNVWFAGEATHPQYFGFLQGAWFEGRNAGESIAACIKDKASCYKEKSYEVLNGTTPSMQYSKENGWTANSFYKTKKEE
ncbi:N1-acetylpolyamine oxidase [Colletotrichum truncatum]|uniref:N1-acetylpolyamine oxidase n=1 Tax=Colletotrichum truncatum TaxID=5467 RepID=A0ACC3YZM4_COLTU|nr:N1-acetylpolyamine oxidase [Colletotrichum truncatum]KAF6781821.1 N1-acetylpolyamine oxidase [Colletotrichum truncatum]